jgi:hypothetical protein
MPPPASDTKGLHLNENNYSQQQNMHSSVCNDIEGFDQDNSYDCTYDPDECTYDPIDTIEGGYEEG